MFEKGGAGFEPVFFARPTGVLQWRFVHFTACNKKLIHFFQIENHKKS
jgi:hypothetical protein